MIFTKNEMFLYGDNYFTVIIKIIKKPGNFKIFKTKWFEKG